MREIVGSSLVAALILGTVAGIASTMVFYDYLFEPGHTDHERGIAWFLVAASSIAAASAAILAGIVYWIITASYRALTRNRTNSINSES